MCTPNGGSCLQFSDCCSNDCANGVCATACQPNGSMCTSAAQCCAGQCNGGVCGASMCPSDGSTCGNCIAGKCCAQAAACLDNPACDGDPPVRHRAALQKGGPPIQCLQQCGGTTNTQVIQAAVCVASNCGAGTCY